MSPAFTAMQEGSEFPRDSANYTCVVPGIVSKAVTNQWNKELKTGDSEKAGSPWVGLGCVFWNDKSPKPNASLTAFISTPFVLWRHHQTGAVSILSWDQNSFTGMGRGLHDTSQAFPQLLLCLGVTSQLVPRVIHVQASLMPCSEVSYCLLHLLSAPLRVWVGQFLQSLF